MSSDAAPEQYTSDDYVQRAELLAELGRYDEAVTDLGAAVTLESGNDRAWNLLARVHLAAGRPGEALTAADTALVTAPVAVAPLVARALALNDLDRHKEAAEVADRLLALGQADAYAQRSAAAILAEARNGQVALNAAWRAVELAPQEPLGHLVLALVAARLDVFDLAERAYQEALRLDPSLPEARHDDGVLRLERRRYAETLEFVAEHSAVTPVPTASGPSIMMSLLRLVMYGAGYSIVAAVLVAFVAAANGPASRIWAVLLAAVGGVVLWRFATQVPELIRKVLPALLRTDRVLALSVWASLAAPVLLLVYALVGGPWPLVLAIVATAVAELAVLGRFGPGRR